MRFAIANTFQKALQKLEGKDAAAAKLAKQSAFEFQMNPAQSGFSFERINKSKDPNFWSLRVSDGIRIIAHRAPDMVTMCYVDRHADEPTSGQSVAASKYILKPAPPRSSRFGRRSRRSRRSSRSR